MAAFNKDTALYYDPSTTAQSASTGPSSYRASSGSYGTRHSNRNSNRNSRGTGTVGRPTATASHTTPELQGNAVMREMDDGVRPPSELLGSTYRPYRPHGGGMQW